MSIEEDLQVIENNMKDIEEYVNLGIWNPDRRTGIAKFIKATDRILAQLKYGHTMQYDDLTEDQVTIVSNMLKRLQNAKDNLPSPPWSK